VAQNKKDELKLTKAGTKDVYEMTKDGKTIYAAFPDETTLVASTARDSVTRALEGKTDKADPDLADTVAAIDNKQSLWAAFVMTPDLKRVLASRPDAKNMARNLMSLKSGSLGITVTDAIAVAIDAHTTDARAAGDLTDQANQAKNLLQGIGALNEEIAPFTNEIARTMEISKQKTSVSIKFKISADVVEQGIKKIPKQ